MWENTVGSVPKNCRGECFVSVPSSLFILVSIVMIYSLKFKVSNVRNERWRYNHRSASAVHGLNCNLCPGFSRECLTWHCIEFMRVKSLHKDKCWKFVIAVSPCGKIIWFTENLKNRIKAHSNLEACHFCFWDVFFLHLANCTATWLAKI